MYQPVFDGASKMHRTFTCTTQKSIKFYIYFHPETASAALIAVK